MSFINGSVNTFEDSVSKHAVNPSLGARTSASCLGRFFNTILKLFGKIGILFLFVFTTSSFANATDDVVAIFKNLNTIQGEFSQTLYSSKNKPLSVSTGTFVIERPNKFVWNVVSPNAQQSISNGKEVWIYQPDLEQASVSPLSKQIGATPLAILSGSITVLKQAYTISKESADVFVFKAKEENSPFNTVKLYFKGDALQSMELFDNLSQKTQIQFSKIKTNQSVSAKIFDFQPPKGTDVIR